MDSKAINKIKLLVLGTTSSDVNIIIRCLREVLHKYHISILIETDQANGILSCFGKNTIIKCNKLKYNNDCAEQIIDIASHYDVVVPSGFDSIKFMSVHLHSLDKVVKLINIPRYDTINYLDDKLTFYEYCLEKNLPHPKSEKLDTLLSGINTWGLFPSLIKYRYGAGSQGIYTVGSKHELENIIKNLDSPEDYIIQQYIAGQDIAFNAYCENGETLAWTMQKFHSVYFMGKKRLRSSKFVSNEEIFKLCQKIIVDNNYSGPINIDIRYDTLDKAYSVIEVNPRFWANTHFSIIDDVNFVDIAIMNIYQKTIKQPKKSGLVWGELIKSMILFAIKHDRETYECIVNQSAVQYKIELIDKLDRLFASMQKVGVK